MWMTQRFPLKAFPPRPFSKDRVRGWGERGPAGLRQPGSGFSYSKARLQQGGCKDTAFATWNLTSE